MNHYYIHSHSLHKVPQVSPNPLPILGLTRAPKDAEIQEKLVSWQRHGAEALTRI